MKSIYFRNFMVNALMVILSFAILGTAFMCLGRSFVIGEKRESLSNTSKEVVWTLRALSRFDGLQSLNLKIYISSISRTTGDHIFVCDESGVVVSCSDEVICPHLGKQIGEQIISQLRENGEYTATSTLDGFYASTYYVVSREIPPQPGQSVTGYAFIGSDSSSVMAAWGTFLTVIFITAAGVILFALIVSFFITKRQAAPLNEMAAAAHRFAGGDFEARVFDDDRQDEIGELTRSFNAMAESLEKSEELRREFIANVSHELKTPMTAISGFADGLLDGTIPNENSEKYLTTISSETKRLSRLVGRMLEASHLRQRGGGVAGATGEFDICEMLRLALISFESKVTAKGLDVNVSIPEESMIALGDLDAMTQVVYNLIDNAIKFSIEGAVIGLCLWKQGAKACVSVKNRGETIPERELPLIFDRFHKADRSRSRDREGVGLGLYIVKSILSSHGEDIIVSSRDGVTEFIFTLSLKQS